MTDLSEGVATKMTTTDDHLKSFIEDWQQWHAAREAELGDRNGWLAVFARLFPTTTPQRIEGVPGSWTSHDETGIVVEFDDGEFLELDGKKLTGRHEFGPFVEREAYYLKNGELIVEVSKWGETYLVRPRSPHTEAVKNFTGIPTFAPDPRWVIEGRFKAFPWARQFHLAAEGGLVETYESPGTVEFDYDGRTHELTVFYGQYQAGPGGIWLLFRDATSGKETYAASRSLRTAPVREDGTVTLDFNRAMNMPCAFTDFTVCALPPAENTLDLAITAGEKTPNERL
jgi:uncharacterized protein (DUF1684 family)